MLLIYNILHISFKLFLLSNGMPKLISPSFPRWAGSTEHQPQLTDRLSIRNYLCKSHQVCPAA